MYCTFYFLPEFCLGLGKIAYRFKYFSTTHYDVIPSKSEFQSSNMYLSSDQNENTASYNHEIVCPLIC